MVVLCMLMSDDQNLREEAMQKIVEIRKKSSRLRKHLASKINFNATEINHLCSLEDTTEPPITMKLSNEEIQSYETHPFEINVPCHRQ